MKYVDAEKLIAEIERLKDEYTDIAIDSQKGWVNANYVIDDLEQLQSQIDSLQQEQPNDLASLISEATTVAKRIVDRDSFYNSLPQNLRNKYTFNAWCEILEALSMMKKQEQSEPVKGKFVFPKFLYARTLDNKTIDVSYVPQSMDAIEYVRNDSIDEQPEIDLEKFTQKMDDWKARFSHSDAIPIKATMDFTARMFYMYPNVAREWYDSLPKVTQD